MMKTSLENRASSGPDVYTSGKGEDKAQLNHSSSPKNCTLPPGISLLEKLIKTCPVWLQLSLTQEKAAEILCKEPAGIFMVRKDENLKKLFLSVHFPAQMEASEVPEYKINEEKSLLNLEGSLLVFEDIFRLVAFYCVSRDLLPFMLKLPQAILEANSIPDLETISNLGIDFWDSSLNQKQRERSPQSVKVPAFISAEAKKVEKNSQRFASSTNNCSCEIELSIGNDRLWFVNPIFIEERSNRLPLAVPLPETCRERPSTGDTNTRSSKKSPSRRPPPPPPPPPPLPPPPPPPPPPSVSPLPPYVVKKPGKSLMTTSEESHFQDLEKNKKEMKTEVSREKEGDEQEPLSHIHPSSLNSSKRIPPSIPPRRCISERNLGKSCLDKLGKYPAPASKQREKQSDRNEGCANSFQSATDLPEVFEEVCQEGSSKLQDVKKQMSELPKKPLEKPVGPPVPPPRKKRISQKLSSASFSYSNQQSTEESQVFSPQESTRGVDKSHSDKKKGSKCGFKPVDLSFQADSHNSLDCPGSNSGAQTPASEPDSYSTSSTEDEVESVTSPSVKKTRSLILGKARHRLSMVSLSNVFTAFLSADRKLQKKIVELAHDKDSYFGNLVQDYKVYSLEMMARQSSSTEMLQEIRLMMTQLKSYLVQSTELKSFMDQAVYTEEQLEVIVESALHKCVLKPLRDAIDSYLREIHSKDGSFKLLKENQQIIQNTTTTDLGVTTSVPESTLLEKILQKFSRMHKAYSPEKKISILLKSCKLIYDSMTQGNPGKIYGADDFLPVLMYVLARSNLEEVLLNVEYMMELMDPALQLGEGSYYLITTYGAVELIKSYDKLTVTRQLSTEVQDSIHRWERRRTLNKARASRSSVQDFITISFMEADNKTRTLAYRTDSTVYQLIQQCAEKFEVSEPQNYGLFLQVDDRNLQLDNDALPHCVKSHLLNKEPKPTFQFIYKEMSTEETPVLIIKGPDEI